MTRKGERVMMPTYGSIIHDLIFEPLTLMTLKEIIGIDINSIIDDDPQSASIKYSQYNRRPDHSINIKLSVSIIPTGEVVELTINLERE